MLLAGGQWWPALCDDDKHHAGQIGTNKSRPQAALFDKRWQGYFFGVSTGVGTLSITEDEVRMLVM
jgi:hypothetical protein